MTTRFCIGVVSGIVLKFIDDKEKALAEMLHSRHLTIYATRIL